MRTIELTVADIMVSDILFFDPAREKACKQFCESWSISFLPDLDHKHYHRLSTSGFQKQEIPHNRKIQESTPLLDEEIREKLLDTENNHEVLFVFHHSFLKGVLHISDFNHDRLLLALYEDFLSFEKSLRDYLAGFFVSKKQGHDAIVAFLKDKAQQNVASEKLKYFLSQEAQDRREVLGPFQDFYLIDLLKFATSATDFLLNKKERGKINLLRNSIMHAKDHVALMPGKEESNWMYNQKTFQSFQDSWLIFAKAYRKLKNLQNFPRN